MGDHVLGRSKLGKEILKLYFSRPEKEYYIRELARILGKPASYVRKVLLKLEKDGLFISEFQGKERYFRLNSKYPLLKEVGKIVSKTIGIEGDLREKLKGIKGIETAFIFGSYASGDWDGLSDIDLMIIGNPDENELAGAVSRIESRIDREINYHIYGLAQFQENAATDDSFVRSALGRPKIFIKGNDEKFSGPDR